MRLAVAVPMLRREKEGDWPGAATGRTVWMTTMAEALAPQSYRKGWDWGEGGRAGWWVKGDACEFGVG